MDIDMGPVKYLVSDLINELFNIFSLSSSFCINMAQIEDAKKFSEAVTSTIKTLNLFLKSNITVPL